MKLAIFSAATCAAALLFGAQAMAAAPSPAITAALADASRPAADKARDAERKSAEVTAFSGIKAGDKVADIWPGGGYYTRIFSSLTGPSGHVYMFIPSEAANRRPQTVDGAKAFAGAYKNVSVVVQKTSEFAINAANYRHWNEEVRLYVDDCMKGSEGPRERDFNMRWIASLVADTVEPESAGLAMA